MSPKKWVVFAFLMLGASLPVFANSSFSDSPGLIASSSESVGAPSATNFAGRSLFRNALQDGSSGNNGIVMANWMSSQPAEVKNQERTATLPEPGSGVLLCLGLLALVSLSGTRLLAHEH